MNNNYELIKKKKVEGLNSDMMLLRHKKTGARVLTLSNDDDNKVFYIGFRTPPEDSTGKPHIIEHTVLCGSDKYPLKDPFVELVKGSMNTFLNAMTYSDKTVYPVASRNDKDFKNLMSVYMDAVFHPNIYKYEEIFRQEGWNYLLESPDDQLKLNGVVYNEMKGAFSSPESVLERKIQNSLFPDTCYGVESGGDPDYIPDLTYEDFLDFHRKYYHPSNSYIFLYGDMDIDERLAWMDEEYLSRYETLEIDSEIKKQEPFSEMKRVQMDYPISEDESEAENTYLAYNLVTGDNLDPKQYQAMNMILYALLDTQGAPIRQALLDEGIGKDILPSYDNGVLQPYFSIISKNAEASDADRFLKIIDDGFRKAAEEGIDKKSLTASLNMSRFKFKEADFGGYPKGLIYGLNAFDSWLYDDENPLLHVDADDTFDELEKAIGTDYYEELIKKFLIDNPHSSLVVLTPKKGMTAEKEALLQEKLDAYKASLSEEEISKLVEASRALSEYQEEETKKEDLEKIPLLERSDIKRDPEDFRNIKSTIFGLPVYWHDYFTNDIAYIDIYFNMNFARKEDLPYIALLKSVMSFVDTENYTYSELNNEINIYTGSLLLGSAVATELTGFDKCSIREFISFRSLYNNLNKAFDLAEEVLFRGKYDNIKRLREIIAEQKSKLQMSMTASGHSAAAMRAASYFSKTAALREQMDGIEFYKFIEDLDRHFDEKAGNVLAKLKELITRIFTNRAVVVSCTCDQKGYDLVELRLRDFAFRLDEFTKKNLNMEGNGTFKDKAYGEHSVCSDAESANSNCGYDGNDDESATLNCGHDGNDDEIKEYYDFEKAGFKPKQLNEAFKTSAGIQYVARAGRYLDDVSDYTGAASVFRTIMNYEYLWFNIRVQGGAYGCMSQAASTGNCQFVTYRDPNLARSNDVFEGIPEYLENFDVDEREMTKFVIGTMSGIDTPLTPAAKGLRDIGAVFGKISYEDIKKNRHEIIDCSADDIRALAPKIRKALDEGNICVIGSEAKIEEDKVLFKNIRTLFE